MPDDKITIYDVAEAAGVSIATVNRALYNKPRVSEKTRKNIMKIAKDLGYTANRAAQALSRNPIKIGVLLTVSITEVTDEVISGINAAIESLASLNVNCKIVTITRGSDITERDVEAYNSLVKSGCNGIIILSGTYLHGMRKAISAAREQGVLTATLVTDIPESERVLAVRSNGQCAGEMAAEELSKLCPGSKVCVFASAKELPICAENLEGFKRGCEKYGLTLGPVFENNDEQMLAYHAVDELYKNHGDVDGIYICSANSQAACKRLEELGLENRYRIVSTDLFENIAENMKKGIINATLFQNLRYQGELAVKTLYKKLSHELDDSKKEILIVPELVMRSNLDPMVARIEAEAKN